ncbi:MAG: efflux transporter outer membrane subunit [Duodenibacillus sp.]|nr:efflux transporter outer membrane subunit [Duodenibacillus sp.]
MLKAIRCLPLAAALALSGCVNLAPDYIRPDAPVAAAWPQEAASKNAVLLAEGLAEWSDFFTDERLKKIIEQGLKNNRSLRAAYFNVERAREMYAVSRADLLPSVSAVASETAQNTPRTLSTTGARQVSHTYSASVAMASYELDFFGRIRNMNEQALQSYFATEAAQRTAQMTVIAEIAQTWLGLGAAKELLALAEGTLKSRRESLKLIEDSYKLGASSQIDVQQALQTVATAEVSRVQAVRSVAQYRHALALLAGGAVAPELEPSGIGGDAAKVVSAVAAMPSELLLARPDIAAAEAQLKSANANIGVARAAFFPRIALTTSAGTGSRALHDLFKGGSGTWSFGPSVSLPLFEGGANLANLRAAKASQKAAVASYEAAVQGAFREVADALAVEGTVRDELRAQEDLARATGMSYRLAEERYKTGVDSYLSVLDSQRADFSARQAVISARLACAASRVTLYKVVGGGSQLSALTAQAAVAQEAPAQP